MIALDAFSDRVAFWDFDDPRVPEIERDTAATAAMACAMLKLAALADPAERADYRRHGEATVSALSRKLPDSGQPFLWIAGCQAFSSPGMLQQAAGLAQPRRGGQSRIRYSAGYYLFEALHILMGKLDPTIIWNSYPFK